MTNPNAPEGWGLSEAEIEQLAQDAVGTPNPADNAWRPAGGSLLGGVGQCLYDELKGIYDLIVMLNAIDRDLDIAADGKDDWEMLRSSAGDAGAVMANFVLLDQGILVFNQLPKPQQLALFRIYAKYELVRTTIKKLAKGGLNMLAAYDVYWSEYSLRNIVNPDEMVLKALADAMSLFFDDDEWLALAEGGKALADKITELVTKQVESDPWGTAGYAFCMVVLLLSPTKIARALKPLAEVLRGMGRAATAGDLRRILRQNNITVPDWLGGNTLDAGDAARAGDAIEDAGELAGDGNRAANDQVDGSDPIDSADDANPQPIRDPAEVEAPKSDRDTTRILGDDVQLRNHTAGEMAELQARQELRDQGYDVIELKEGQSQAGIDAVAVKYDADMNVTEIKVVEVKSTQYTDIPDTSLPSSRQASGGASHLDTMLTDVLNPRNRGKYSAATRQLAQRIRAGQANGVPVDAQVWRYRVNTFSDEINQKATTSWTARNSIPADDFDIDTGFGVKPGRRDTALGNVLERMPSFGEKYPELLE